MPPGVLTTRPRPATATFRDWSAGPKTAVAATACLTVTGQSAATPVQLPRQATSREPGFGLRGQNEVGLVLHLLGAGAGALERRHPARSGTLDGPVPEHRHL